MVKHVAVLMGGWSSEREISLKSGKAVAEALEKRGYKVSRIDVDRDIAEVLKEMRPHVAFNALHGPYGEDGCIQGVLEILDIDYTHSGVMASSLAMNKDISKAVLKAAGVPVAEHKILNRYEAARKHALKPPYVIKPIAEGSSYGVIIVDKDTPNPPDILVEDEWPYPNEVMIERYIPGRELTCSVMGDVALGVTEILSDRGKFYDYDAKYLPGGSKHILPAELPTAIYQEIQLWSLKAHQALGCRGVSRADFRYDDRIDGTGEVICLEVNTQPGMTATSLVPEQVAHSGQSFEDLVVWMVEDASCNR